MGAEDERPRGDIRRAGHGETAARGADKSVRVDGVKKHEPALGLNAAGVNADVANTAVAKTSVRIIVPSQTRGSRGGRLERSGDP